MARYERLRFALGSVAFFPLLTVATEAQAYSIEAIIISSVQPDANKAAVHAEQQRKRVPAKVRHHRLPKSRPFPCFRQPLGLVSLFSLPIFLSSVGKRFMVVHAQQHKDAPAPMNFNHAYRAMQQKILALRGTIGPLTIFSAKIVHCFSLGVIVGSLKLTYLRGIFSVRLSSYMTQRRQWC